MIDGLPPESATKTALRDTLTDAQVEHMRKTQVDAPHGPWAKSDYLLAALIDAVNVLTATVSGALGGKSDFEPVDRPFLPKRPASGLDDDQRAYLERVRAARGAHVA